MNLSTAILACLHSENFVVVVGDTVSLVSPKGEVIASMTSEFVLAVAGRWSGRWAA